MDKELINFLRVTSCLEIEKANSGHPGVCLSLAPMAFEVYKHAFINPEQPNFLNRDRIVFSCGHASALVYSLLNLFGYDVSVQDLESFRQLGSKTAGHPEVNLTAGVDASTGPLGQGVGMSVGMAVAEAFLRKKYEKGNLKPISHFTYCFVGDGDLMEGVAQESISLAGHLKLSKLIMCYDKNDITIEGSTSLANTENVANKFLAQNWNVINVRDGNDEVEIEKAILSAKISDKPTIIIAHTKIGYGSDLQGTATVHGKPLSREQIETLRKNLNYFAPDYKIPENEKSYLEQLKNEKQKEFKNYLTVLDEYKRKFDKEFLELTNLENYFTFSFASLLETKPKIFDPSGTFNARKTGHEIINSLYEVMPNLISSSADLDPSTHTNFENCGLFAFGQETNRNIDFGIREHAMGAVCNGISLHGGLRALCSTFLAFENYMTPAIRLSAFMQNPVLFYFTHDSIGVGEDGPTHQPIEQLATLRAMPNLNVFRPCGQSEMLAGFELFFKNHLPLAMTIPRQVTPICPDSFEKATRGGYAILSPRNFDITIIATGSEVSLAIRASQILMERKILAKVVSMPCVEVFEREPKAYRNKIVDRTKPVFCVECSSDNIWFKFATQPENVIGMNTFGKSGKMEDVFKFFGFTPEQLADKIENILKK
jgi:transketolase